MKAFLSSTYLDLKRHRSIVAKALQRLDIDVRRMEVFGARPAEPSTACLSEIEGCDLFVGIYAHRYGFIPSGLDISITEQEFNRAHDCNKAIFCFFVHPKTRWPAKLIEGEPGKSKLANFRQRVSGHRVLDTFTTPLDLGLKVATSVGRYLSVENAPQRERAAMLVGEKGSLYPIIYPGSGESEISWKLEDYAETSTTAPQSDLTIEPEIARGIKVKMEDDFAGGALSAPIIFKAVHDRAEVDLSPITNVAGRYASLDLSAISSNSWWGIPDIKTVNILRGTTQWLGRSILISCSSVNVAAYSVLKGFARHGIPIEVSPEDASGREQAITIRGNPKFDFVVCADAPLFLDHHDNVRSYAKIFEMYQENQFLIGKRGLAAKSNPPTVYVYQASSAEQHFLLAREDKDRFQLPVRLNVEELSDMADFNQVSKIMKPGDGVFAWGALARRLLTDPSLKKVRRTDFALTVSVFRHPNWSS